MIAFAHDTDQYRRGDHEPLRDPDNLSAEDRDRLLWELHLGERYAHTPRFDEGPPLLMVVALFFVPAFTLAYLGWHLILWALGQSPPG